MSDAWDRPVSGWPVGTWAMAGMLPIATGIGISARVLSPGLALDAISLWPGLVPVALALVVVAFRKAWRRRMGALPPLLLITWMVLAGAAHLSAWPPLPSSSANLIGSGDVPDLATMSAHSGGRLIVRANDPGTLYEVGFIRLGGPVGIPGAEESTTAIGLAINLTDLGTTEWFQYAGWVLDLAPGTVWNLSLTGDVNADMTGLDVGSVSIDGTGLLILGPTDHPVPVAARGQFELRIQPGVPARVVGLADVPVGWVSTAGGFQAPVDGEGWVISVAEGSSVAIATP